MGAFDPRSRRKRPPKPKEVWSIRFWLDQERRLRDRALFDLAIARSRMKALCRRPRPSCFDGSSKLRPHR